MAAEANYPCCQFVRGVGCMAVLNPSEFAPNYSTHSAE